MNSGTTTILEDGTVPCGHNIFLGYRPSCECWPTTDENDNATWLPGIVFDPFLGSGTVGMVARELGLRWVGLDLAHEYLDQQAKIRTKTGQPSNALDGLPMFADATGDIRYDV